jgi:hypothetical protein
LLCENGLVLRGAGTGPGDASGVRRGVREGRFRARKKVCERPFGIEPERSENENGSKNASLEALRSAKGADYASGIALVGVHFGIEVAHFVGGDLAGEIGERRAKLRKLVEGIVAHDGDRVVRRKIVKVVIERNEVQRVDEAVGGVAGDDVNLMVDKRAIEEAQIHDVGRLGELQIVTTGPAGEAVGTFEKFVAHADAEFTRDRRKVGHGVKMGAIGVVSAYHHGEGVGEAERLGEIKMEFFRVLQLDAVVDRSGSVVGLWRFVEHGGESGAGVFDVEVEVAGEERFVDEEGTAEISFALDVNTGLGFDVLGEEFGEKNLFGEEFGADGQVR